MLRALPHLLSPTISVEPVKHENPRWAGLSLMGRAGIEPATLGLKVASEARSAEISRDETVQ